MIKDFKDLKKFLDAQVDQYNKVSFILSDPISIPHRYSDKKDIEISAFWTAILSWGRRSTIINKSQYLFQDIMGDRPYDFILNHTENDLKALIKFKHRTFLADDALYFLSFLKSHYEKYDSLEDAFLEDGGFVDIENGLNHFRKYFFKDGLHLKRTEKHISAPFKKSTCKRLNMFLRWMVRKDDSGVDFGIWNRMTMDKLMIPYDVHVDRIARKLGLVERKQRDWKTVVQLTHNLSQLDPIDPVKYDFALFGMGVLNQFP